MIQKFEYKRATMEDIDELVRTRIIVLRAANKLSDDEDMSVVEEKSYAYYRRALETGEHIAYLVYDNGKFIGAGGVSFYQVMPTYHNPTGKKAYIMNMYTAPEYRRQGIAFHTLDLLVKDESQGIEIALSPEEIDSVFWDAAAPGKPTVGIREFLTFLKEKQIRTGVISNISYCGNAVAKRINDCIPNNNFEFIIATSEYMYRKPNKHIFELALEKAELQPEDVWYIGDQYQCDIVGASAAGLFPVWYIGAIDLKYEPKEDILTIEHWKELIDLLKKLD